MKIISKVLSTRIKIVLSFLISSNQTAHVKNRFISESGGRVISDISEIAHPLALEGFLVTVDIEKAFDSVNRWFLLQILRQFGFGIDFASWIKTIVKDQESCIINRGKTTKYFKLERGARQGDPISAYLFILVLEIFFIFIKNNPKVQGLSIFKVELSPCKNNCVICFIESTLKIIKNAFYFILKAPFVLKIFTFLS